MNTDPSQQVQRPIEFRSRHGSVRILWVLVVILVIFNLALLYGLNLARLIAIETLSGAETMLDRLAGETIIYNIALNQPVPMKADIPFNQTVEIPVNTTVPIDQQVRLPFVTAAGETTIDIPLRTSVPINTVIPVDFNETISVDTVVHLNTTVPVEIEIARTGLAGYLIQARQDVSKLRHLLAFQFGASPGEPLAMAGESEPGRGPGSDGETGRPGQTGSGATAAGPAPESGGGATGDAPAGSTTRASSDLGRCAHPYWPLDPGATWIYHSPVSSFIQRVDALANDQAVLSTQYEGRDIGFGLVCSQAGLGGDYLGDVRRITELGALTFSPSEDPFLPGAEIMERIGQPWSQEFNVSGTVQARQGAGLLEGRVRQGQARAVYTPYGLETVTTPFGPRQALRIEQKLELNLEIGFDLGGRPVPVTEQVSLTNVYWFAKDIGLVKLHWQGGRLRRVFELNQAPVSEDIAIGALPEDALIAACLLDGPSITCTRASDAAEANLVPSTASELDIPLLVFPESAAGTASSLPPLAGAEETGETATDNVDPENNEAAAPPTVTPRPDRDSGALLAYAAAAAELGKKINDAARIFGQAALRYRSNELSRDEFRANFTPFRQRVKDLIGQINRLSPPPAASDVHQKLTAGLDKCDQAVDLMDSWFETSDSGARDAATLLVGACTGEVSAAQAELAGLIN